MVKAKKIMILLILAPFLLIFSHKPAGAASIFRNIAAESALLTEADSGIVLFEYKAGERQPVDALTKVMTLLLAVSACETGAVAADDLVTMSESAWYNVDSLSTTLNIMPGEEMTFLDLMYCAFIGDANEACNLIAEHIAGSTDAFVTRMNARAKELGCDDTRYVNTHGRYHYLQLSTAQDQYIIYHEALSHPLFVEIAGAFRYETEGTEDYPPRILTNSNMLLNQNSKYNYRPCTSGRTSATYEGGHSYIGFAEADGLSLIAVVLGSDEVMYEDESVDLRNFVEARRLFEWGFAEFSWRIILSPSDLVGRAPVTHGAGADYVILRPDSEIKLLVDNSIPNEEFIRNVKIYSTDNGDTLYAPITAGDVLGEVTVTRNGVNYGTVKLTASTDIELHRLQYIRMQASELFSSTIARRIMWVLFGLVALYLALVIRYNIVRIRRIRRIKTAKRRLAKERRTASTELEWRDEE